MGYSIYRADLEKNKDEILAFWKENHEKTLDKKYKWIYEGNPAGQAVVWILRDDVSQHIVGMDVIFPRKYSVEGMDVLAGISGDFLVSKKHRTLGPAMMIQRSIVSSVEAGEFDFIYGFPNKNAEPAIKRIGFERLGEVVRLVKIIRTQPFIIKKNLPWWLVKSVSPILNLIFKIVYDTMPLGHNNYFCKEVKEVDGSFDRFWQGIKSRHAVVGDRSASTISWKYLNDPDDENKIYAVFKADSSALQGYIIYRLDADAVDIRDISYIDEKALKTMIPNFVKYVSPLNKSSIVLNLLENDYIIDTLKRFGFMYGNSDKRVYIYCNKEKMEQVISLIRKAENWWLMRSDEDS